MSWNALLMSWSDRLERDLAMSSSSPWCWSIHAPWCRISASTLEDCYVYREPANSLCGCSWQVCKEMQAAIGAADLFWERQCQEIGFSTQHGPSHVEPPGWYRYYCMRMKERYTIRQGPQRALACSRLSARQVLMGVAGPGISRCLLRRYVAMTAPGAS